MRIAIAYDGNNKFSDNILINNIDVGGVGMYKKRKKKQEENQNNKEGELELEHILILLNLEGTGCHNYTVTLPAGKTGTKVFFF